MTSADLQNRLKAFAYRVVTVFEALPKKKIARVIGYQILRYPFLLRQITGHPVKQSVIKLLFPS